ncbi:MAG: N-acetylmuramoyl-L-alanine amidase family protein [Chthoniobacterales bacterium]
MVSRLRCARRRVYSLGCFRRGLRSGMIGALLFSLFFAYLPTPTRAADRPRTIVIDPGHGGFDRGGIPGQRVAEKTMALDVALRLAKKLRDAGFRVIMTRNTDVFVPLGTRVRIANSQKDAAFVCVHFNSATRVGANGIETYYYRSDSARLAASVHRQVVGGTTTDNRGIRRRGFYVLRKTNIPSILVECGFLTNPTEAQLALQSSYRDRLAQRIADGIIGKSTPFNRPVVAGLTHVNSPYAGSYRDFVSSAPERSSISHHSSKKKKKSSAKKKKTTSKKKTKKKKK